MLDAYRPLFPYLRRYRVRYAVGAACVVLSVALRMLIPWLLGQSLDELRTGEVGRRGEELVVTAALTIVVAACIGAVIRTWSRWMILGNSRLAVHDLRQDVFTHLLRLSPSFYVRHQTGHLMSRLVNDMQNVQGLLGPVFMYLVETVVVYAVGLVFMLMVDPLLTLYVLAPFPLFLFYARILAGRVQRGTRVGQEKLAALSSKVDESLGGQRVIKGLALEDFDRGLFDARAASYRDTMLEVARVRATLQPAMLFLSSLSTFVLLAVGGPMVVAGTISLGELLAMIYWLLTLAAPTATMGFVISSLQRGAAALARLVEVLRMPITLVDPPEPVADAVQSGGIEVRDLTVTFPALADLPHLSGSLPELPEHAADGRHVGRHHAEQLALERTVLDGVSFAVAPGQTLGVVGATGSGKSLLLRALSRQLEVPAGQVFFDGVDITRIALRDLRAAVGVVPQEAFLFSRSLAENIALGRPGATRAEIDAVVQTAQLAGDLDHLPEGLDTLVGERGVKLSGGQRQRAALARLLLLQPRILLLDDTLSAVDVPTGERIVAGLNAVMRDRTTILVAHRVATVQDADHIIVLDAGRIVERGDHAGLLRKNGVYASLHRSQVEHEKLRERLDLYGEAIDAVEEGRLP